MENGESSRIVRRAIGHSESPHCIPPVGEEDEWEEKADAMQERLQGARIHAAEVARDLENSRSRLTEWCERMRWSGTAPEEPERQRKRQRRRSHSRPPKKRKAPEIAALQTEIEALQKTAQELHGRGDALDSALTALQARLKEQTAKKDLVTTAHNKNENRLASFVPNTISSISKLWEDYELSYATAKHSGIRRENRAQGETPDRGAKLDGARPSLGTM
ncbi:MAG: hypothetical protein V8R75_16320 [Oscillospiraceae bacterium]